MIQYDTSMFHGTASTVLVIFGCLYRKVIFVGKNLPWSGKVFQQSVTTHLVVLLISLSDKNDGLRKQPFKY